MRRIATTALAFLCLSSAANAQAVIVALSTERVEITSNFTGASVTVFGAADDYGAGIEAPFEIVVVLRGPAESVITRRKDRLLGLWINRAEAHFDEMPAFYALQATTPITDIAEPDLLAAEGLGLASLVERASVDPDDAEFANAFVRLRQDSGLYVENAGTIDRLGGSVFRTSFDLPADVPIGAYIVDVFLFQNGTMVTMSSAPLEISKTGAEQFIFDISRESPWLYAIAVVLIAAMAGWLGGVIFRRD